MNLLFMVLYFIAALLLLILAVTVINILQNGGKYRGQVSKNILGKDLDTVTIEDIMALSKAQFKQLYHSLPAPSFSDLDGEYLAKNLPAGILAGGVNFFTDHFFGPGKWVGKAFKPLQKDSSWGYNIFQSNGTAGDLELRRTRKMNTYIGTSAYDDGPAFHLDYSPYNGGIIHSMRDELRKVNGDLFIGMGCMALGGGTINPSPFMVYGKPKPWVGL